MTVSTEDFRWAYTSTGGTTYQYLNKILTQEDLTVYASSVLQTIGTDYTVDGVGDATGGNVTFLAAPAAGTTILITKDGVAFTQDHDYTENDPFPAASHEDALDKQTNLAQKIWDYVRRSVKVAITSTLTDLEFPTPEAGKVLAWNGTATAIENVTLSGVGGISDTAYNSSTWDGITEIAPSKNAVRDKIEAMISDTAYNSTTWNGEDTVAPSKNAVRDEFEVLRAAAVALVSDTAYNSTTWNNVTTIAPSKNAVRDELETKMPVTGYAGNVTFDGIKTASGTTGSIAAATPTTIFAASGNSMYIVFAYVSAAGSANYTAYAFVMTEGSDARISSGDGALLTLTLSGLNVQTTQNSGGAATVNWKALKIV